MMNVISKILGSILKSVFISVVMFLIAFSVITGEFPPNLGRLKKVSTNLQEMVRLSRQIHERQKDLKVQKEEMGEMDAQDVEALTELNLRRAELGAGLLQPEQPQNGKSTEAELQSQITIMQKQIFRLQDRLAKLEAKVK